MSLPQTPLEYPMSAPAPFTFDCFVKASEFLEAKHARMDRHESLAVFTCDTAMIADLSRPEGDVLAVVQVWKGLYVLVRYQQIEGRLVARVMTTSRSWVARLFHDGALKVGHLAGQTPLEYFLNTALQSHGGLKDVEGDLGHDYVIGPLARIEEDCLESECEVARERHEFDAYGDRDLCR